jgi:hypothetical protein
MRRPPLNLLNKTFDKLTVLGRGSKPGYWSVQCSCGSPEREVRGTLLNTGKTKSCGCSGRRHGQSNSLTYRRWESMLARCRKYGFSYDPRWKDFPTFLADRGECPEGLTLDRVITGDADIEFDYGPSNCRWACKLQQTANRKNSKILSVRQGNIVRRGTAGEWARFLRETSGNKNWTVDQLHQVMKSMDLATIVQGYFPNLLWLVPEPLVEYHESDAKNWAEALGQELRHTESEAEGGETPTPTAHYASEHRATEGG